MQVNDIVKFNGELGKVIQPQSEVNVLRFLPCNYGTYYRDDLHIVTFEDLTETTFEEKVKFIETEYHWGKVVKTHCVGDYQIIEDKREYNGKEEICFHLYINFVDRHISYESIDKALIGAICCKYDGCDERLSGYINKALNM